MRMRLPWTARSGDRIAPMQAGHRRAARDVGLAANAGRQPEPLRPGLPHGALLVPATPVEVYDCSPPSTAYCAPVTKLAPAEHRKETTEATSSGFPERCSGRREMKLANSSSCCSFVSPIFSTMGVSMEPGLTALTRMPAAPSSRAHARVSARTAALLAE